MYLLVDNRDVTVWRHHFFTFLHVNRMAPPVSTMQYAMFIADRSVVVRKKEMVKINW